METSLNTPPSPSSDPQSRSGTIWRWAWGSLLSLLGIALIAGGTWMAWRGLAAPEALPLPTEVTLRHMKEREAFIWPPQAPTMPTLDAKGLIEAANRKDEQGMRRMQDAYEKELASWKVVSAERQQAWETERTALQEKQAAEAHAERRRAGWRELYYAGGGVIGGLLLVGMGIGAWLKPALHVS